MERRKYRRIGRKEWQKHVLTQARSRQSIAEYCRKAGLSESGFYVWRKRLRCLGEDSGFIRVDSGENKAEELRITTPNGFRVETVSVAVGISVARRLAQTC